MKFRFWGSPLIGASEIFIRVIFGEKIIPPSYNLCSNISDVYVCINCIYTFQVLKIL